MGHGGLHAELGGGVEHPAADPDGDLGADDLRGGGSLGAVADHEPDAEEVDGGSGGEVDPVAARGFDAERGEHGGDAGGEGEGLRDVAGGGEGISLHHLQVGEEVGLDGGVEDGWGFGEGMGCGLVSGWMDVEDGVVEERGGGGSESFSYRNKRIRLRSRRGRCGRLGVVGI